MIHQTLHVIWSDSRWSLLTIDFVLYFFCLKKTTSINSFLWKKLQNVNWKTNLWIDQEKNIWKLQNSIEIDLVRVCRYFLQTLMCFNLSWMWDTQLLITKIIKFEKVQWKYDSGIEKNNFLYEMRKQKLDKQILCEKMRA